MKKAIFIFTAFALVASAIGFALLQKESFNQVTTAKKMILPEEKEGLSEEATEKLPKAISKHMEKLLEAAPTMKDDGGENRGNYGAGEQELLALAYPGTDITLAEVNAAQSAATSAKKRGFSNGNGAKGSWVSVGPSHAEVPFLEFRDTTQYVPSSTISAGRTNAFAISPNCTSTNCRLWISAAGGGIWRTDKAIGGTPNWTYLSTPFEINSGDTIFQDPNDASGNTLWVGTGEGGACGDCAFGVGIYKTTNGGNSWTGPLGKSYFNARAVTSIAVPLGQPNVVYAGVVRSSSGISSVAGGGVSITVPGAQLWGLWKSTDGGSTFSYIHNGAAVVCNVTAAALSLNTLPCSARGTRRVAVDPADGNVVYASSYGRGIWRSPDAGATWEQIKQPLNGAGAPTVLASSSFRNEFAITLLGDGNTRMYVGEGDSGAPTSRFSRSDNVRSGVPTFTNLTSSNPADPGYGSFNYCTGQCWYDQFIHIPKGHPDIVYLSGSYVYNENDPFHADGWVSNGRGVVLSQDAGVSWTDQSYDATDLLHPFGLHPDHHALITNPANPLQFFDGSDGGVVLSSGKLVDISSQCDFRTQFGLAGDKLARCRQLLSAVPSRLTTISKGLTTLQFQSVLANPHKPTDLQGGTQDNGTWENYANSTKWLNTDIGDGGQSGFDAADSKRRFHTFFASQVFTSTTSGGVADWNWIADPFFIAGQGQSGSFYIPIIYDPNVSQTLYAGINNVWRTKTYGRGSMSEADLKTHCNLWTGDFAVICGDWVRLGPTTLTTSALGDRSGGFVTAAERTTADNTTLWAATSTGRVFISQNADAEPEASVAFTRLDGFSTVDPARFVTSIFVDPNDANHAWITYSGFNIATPTEPGHVFSVQFNPAGPTATWTLLDGSGIGSLGDLPVNDGVFDSATGNLYIATDFGVLVELAGGSINWQLAAPGMPNVETPGLDINVGARQLIAATHGLGAWKLNLP